MTIATIPTISTPNPVRVLVVDDSAATRGLICRELGRDPGITVIGAVADAYAARDKIVTSRPDVITLDIRMPRMDGITFLRRLMKYHPLPVVVISSFGAAGAPLALEAMAAGAVDVVCKPAAGGIQAFSSSLIEKVKAAANATVHTLLAPPRSVDVAAERSHPSATSVIAIGASTGGVQAITRILSELPADMPPILVVQHMPPGFTASFAQRLDGIVALEVKEAGDGDVLRAGQVLVAPGGLQIALRCTPDHCFVEIKRGADATSLRPSVDHLFDSVAQSVGASAVGVLLTGMGADGARGLLNMRRAGARTMAQDEQSCTVFGMPAEAIRLGAAGRVLPLDRMASTLVELTADRMTVNAIGN